MRDVKGKSEISERVQKSLMMSLPFGEQGLGTGDTDTEYFEKLD